MITMVESGYAHWKMTPSSQIRLHPQLLAVPPHSRVLRAPGNLLDLRHIRLLVPLLMRR